MKVIFTHMTDTYFLSSVSPAPLYHFCHFLASLLGCFVVSSSWAEPNTKQTSCPHWKVKSPVAKPDNLSFIHRTHPVEGEKKCWQVFLWSPHIGSVANVWAPLPNKWIKTQKRNKTPLSYRMALNSRLSSLYDILFIDKPFRFVGFFVLFQFFVCFVFGLCWIPRLLPLCISPHSQKSWRLNLGSCPS